MWLYTISMYLAEEEVVDRYLAEEEVVDALVELCY